MHIRNLFCDHAGLGIYPCLEMGTNSFERSPIKLRRIVYNRRQVFGLDLIVVCIPKPFFPWICKKPIFYIGLNIPDGVRECSIRFSPVSGSIDTISPIRGVAKPAPQLSMIARDWFGRGRERRRDRIEEEGKL